MAERPLEKQYTKWNRRGPNAERCGKRTCCTLREIKYNHNNFAINGKFILLLTIQNDSN
jgi:hypothetical protein